MIIKNQPNKIYLNYGDLDDAVAYIKCETVANMLDEIEGLANGMIASGNELTASYALKIQELIFKAITAMEGS